MLGCHLDLQRPLPRRLVRVDHVYCPQRQVRDLVDLLDYPVALRPVEVPQQLEAAGHVGPVREELPELHWNGSLKRHLSSCWVGCFTVTPASAVKSSQPTQQFGELSAQLLPVVRGVPV